MVDPSGVVVPGVQVRLAVDGDPNAGTSVSDRSGWFRFDSLPPGAYELYATKPDFRPAAIPDISVHVTETVRLEVHLELATVVQQALVSSHPLMIQLDTPALGRTVDEEVIVGSPLATRNFSQLAGLSPGVITGVYNAGELGTGGTALSQIGPSNDGLYVHGARSYDNNWQLDGISVSDVLGTSSASGGIPIPSPDALEEFKVQTGLYDANFGRGAGANISVITKQGGSDYHGSAFEYLRNDVVNANDFFLNRTGQRRPPLKQNQFGVTLGGRIQRDKITFFGSYQGTRQVNGIAAGQARVACTASLSEPALTSDRSAAAIGALFSGLSGALGGVAIKPDGSNINPAALALLNFKLSDGSFLIPNPQTVDSSRPMASQGFSVFSKPCDFDEDQFMLNGGYLNSEKNRFDARFFQSASNQSVTFPGNGNEPAGNIPGFPSPGALQFVVLSIGYTRYLLHESLNDARIGFVRTRGETDATAPFAWSDVGVAEGDMNRQNELPSLQILGSASMAPAFPRTYTQNSLVFTDVFTKIIGPHALRFGGSLTHMRDPLHFAGFNSFVEFLSWPDFLLGLDAAANGTGMFSNVYQSSDAFGLLDRDFRVWEGSAFALDDYRVNSSLTLNGGLRYERAGQFGDALGRNSSFDFDKAEGNPLPEGSLAGYIVASNFPGQVPQDVVRADNTFGTYGEGQNTFAPRAGFALKVLPEATRLALRGGYGIYYSRPTGQAFTASVLAAPFGLIRTSTGPSNAPATFQAPFAQPFPTASSFPKFIPYTSSTQSSINTLAAGFKPAAVHEYSLSVQTEFERNWLLEAAYFGAHGTHLQRFRSLNQALNASLANPIRGNTSNTLVNIPARVPIPGIRPDSLRVMESEGASSYNGLEASLTKRLSDGVQFLAAYTFSKTLDTDGANINGTSGVNALTLGDQNSPARRWGRASFDRPHRFVVSAIWSLPRPPAGVWRAVFANWDLASIITIQTGSALTIADTNAHNVYGISEDRAQLSGSCTNGELVNRGSVVSKVGAYFDASCFANPPVIGADGQGTAFGNSGTGMVNGPGQANVDLAGSKSMALSFPRDRVSLEFRAEFFNLFNHPQFSNPDTNFTSPTFGEISSTAVGPRVGQIAVRLMF